MDRDSLESLFVGRHRALDDVVNKIRSSSTGDQKHYFLIVGPRGSGKTHFVALAYHRLKDEAAQLPNLVIAFLNEEEWGVASYLDFIVRILRSLPQGDTGVLSTDIDRIFSKFSKSQREAHAFAENLLKRHLKGKTLLLICENLVDLFEGLGEEGQKRWRTLIQETGNWTILATTPALFSAISLQNCPFFGFFTIRHLSKVDYETALELLVRKALHEEKAELASFLQTPIGRARVRAIHHLAGGNHRVYVVLSDFLNKQSLNDLVGPFMQMVDDLTPYYQDRMRQLAPAKRKIVEFLCRHAVPLTVKDIAIPCLMSQQTAAKQLGDLAKDGFINRVQLGRNTMCELAEPLMRICIEIKDNRSEHLQLFVEFLRRWFSSRELGMRLTHAAEHKIDRNFDRDHISEAMHRYSIDHKEPFIEALLEEGFRCLESKDFPGLATVQTKIAQETGDSSSHAMPAIVLLDRGEIELAFDAAREAEKIAPNEPEVHFALARCHWYLDQYVDALNDIDRAITLDASQSAYRCFRGNVLYELDRYLDVVENEKALLNLQPKHWHSYDQIIYSLLNLDRTEEARVYADELLQKAPDRAETWVAVSSVEANDGNIDLAEEAATKALHIDSNDASALRARGQIYLEAKHDYPAAIADFKSAIKKSKRQRAGDYCGLSRSFLYSGDFEKAEKAAARVLTIDPSHFHGHYVRGVALLERGKVKRGVESLRRLLAVDRPQSLAYAAEILLAFGQFAEAHRFVDRLLLLAPGDERALLTRVELLLTEDKFADAVVAARSAIENAPHNFRSYILLSQARAGLEPLASALAEVITTVWPTVNEDWATNDYAAQIAEILRISLSRHGPNELVAGVRGLVPLLATHAPAGTVAGILTHLLEEDPSEFLGTVNDWVVTLNELNRLFSNLPETKIPLEMLTAHVLYQKSGDRKYLLALPLEQRTLLKTESDGTTVH